MTLLDQTRDAGTPHAPRSAWFLAVVLVALLCLSLRTAPASGTSLVHPALWAEDGNVFLAAARTEGWASVTTPSAGYLHLGLRVAAVPLSQLPLEMVPWAFHAAWLCAFIGWVGVLATRLHRLGVVGIGTTAWTLAVLALQPQAGEVLFSLTNAQWFTGAALFVYLLCPWPAAVGPGTLLALAMSGLTGPFSTLVLPFLGVRAVLVRDARTHWRVYVTVLACGLLQAVMLSGSSRIVSMAPAPAVHEWLAAYFRFFVFGNEYPLASVAALAMWAAIPLPFMAWPRLLRGRRDREDVIDGHGWLLACAALGLMTMAFLRDDLTVTSPVISRAGAAGGSRYYFLPYTLLLLFGASACRRARWRQVTFLAAATLACATTLVRTPRVDQQWPAFVALARAVPDITIPINPRIPAVPGWYAPGGSEYRGGLVRRIPIPLAPERVVVQGGALVPAGDSLISRSTSAAPLLILALGSLCGPEGRLGVEVGLSRATEGWVQFLWGRDATFTEADSLLRYYPAGVQRALFAFERSGAINSIGIRPTFVAGETLVTSVTALCLD